MYVIFPANRARVAEARRHGVDRLDDVAVGFASAGGDTHAPQFDRGEHGAAPGAEVLGADVAPGERAQIGIDVIRGDRLALAGGVEVLEQLLAGQVAAALDDVREPGSESATMCSTPLLPRKLKRSVAPSTCTWRGAAW